MEAENAKRLQKTDFDLPTESSAAGSRDPGSGTPGQVAHSAGAGAAAKVPGHNPWLDLMHTPTVGQQLARPPAKRKRTLNRGKKQYPIFRQEVLRILAGTGPLRTGQMVAELGYKAHDKNKRAWVLVRLNEMAKDNILIRQYNRSGQTAEEQEAVWRLPKEKK